MEVFLYVYSFPSVQTVNLENSHYSQMENLNIFSFIWGLWWIAFAPTKEKQTEEEGYLFIYLVKIFW